MLGEGGSAIVYDARWGHRSIALKVVRADLGEADRRRFLDESRLLIEMAHPGVVKALSAGTLPDGRTYLAMEKLPGRTLAERLGDGPIELPTAIHLFDQLCDAVAAMHTAGLLHRDLKPENVMLVDSDGAPHAVLLDFGIAKAMTDGVATLTTTGQVRGTPAYMAPERFFGQPATVTTDVYELAVTLFAMIAGRLPWDDDAEPDARLNPMRLRDTVEVPAALDEAVARALSTRAANRPPDVASLRDAVRRASGVAIAAPTRVTAPVPLPIAPTVPSAPQAGAPGQPWRRSGGAVTTGSTASGERVGETTTEAAPRRRRRWPLVVATVGLAGAASTAAVIAFGVPGRGAASSVKTPDPWAQPGPTGPAEALGPAPPPLARLELTAARRTELRDAIGQVLAHHAPDASAVVTVSLAELRASDELAPVLTRAHESTLLDQLTSLFVGQCPIDLAGRGDWVSLAVVNTEGESAAAYDLIASGAWTRAELERCLMTGRSGEVTRKGAPGVDGEPLSVIPTGTKDTDVIAWLDDHTFFATTRAPDPAFLAARLRGTGKPGPLQQIGSRFDRRATGWAVSRREALETAVEDPALRADFTARLELDDDGVEVAGVFYLPDARRADAAERALRTQLDALFDTPLLKLALPDVAIERDGTAVRARGRLPLDLVAKLKDVLVEAMP